MRSSKLLAALLAWAVLATPAAAYIYPSAYGQEPVRARHAMVASQHELASQIGVDVMKKGGNAVDAAVAVGLALAVVYPEAGNIGGGGFMLIRKPSGETHTIDYREKAPAAAHRDVFVDEKGELIKGEGSSTLGYRAAGVPGTLAGFELAFRRYGSGRIKWGELVEPARLAAKDGFRLSHRVAELLKSTDAKDLARYDDSKRIFLHGGKFYQEGDVLRQPELAQTLARVAKHGAAEFYAGTTARMIAADMKEHGSLMTLDDLKNYQAKERAPIRGTYRGHEIISIPPPSSGGIVMSEILNMLEGYDIRAMRYNSAAKYHLVAEAMRRAFADRAEYMGDADLVDVPVAKLIDKRYAASRRTSIDMTRASASSEIRYGQITNEPTETTHYTIVDKDGMVVSNTYTLNDVFGSKVTAKGTGVLLNDEMDDFAARPGKPNLFGLIQGERNSVQPGKRPLSSMTPTIVLRKDGSFWFALGARGGPRIISAVVQIIVNMIDHDMDIQDAMDAPRVHHQWLPDEVLYEPLGFSPDTLSVLSERGHRFAEKPAKVASATAVMVDEKGIRLGVIDWRSDGAAAGY
jgi:gamma-glutamyltranspeptidase / glutathione hydrolase